MQITTRVRQIEGTTEFNLMGPGSSDVLRCALARPASPCSACGRRFGLARDRVSLCCRGTIRQVSTRPKHHLNTANWSWKSQTFTLYCRTTHIEGPAGPADIPSRPRASGRETGLTERTHVRAHPDADPSGAVATGEHNSIGGKRVFQSRHIPAHPEESRRSRSLFPRSPATQSG